jgi:hypothetical protein
MTPSIIFGGFTDPLTIMAQIVGKKSTKITAHSKYLSATKIDR